MIIKRARQVANCVIRLCQVTFVLVSLCGVLDCETAQERAQPGREVVTARLEVQLGHTSYVGFTVFAPNGHLILTTSYDHKGCLWDVASGVELRCLQGHTSAVISAIFSTNSSAILTASEDGTARLWDVATGQELRRFVHTNTVHSALFAPDGRAILTVSEDWAARLWDVATGQELRRFGHPTEVELRRFGGTSTNLVYSALFAPDGRAILTASKDGTACLWDVATGQELRCFVHTDTVYSALFSPDGRAILTASIDGTACLWDAATGQKLRSFTGLFTPNKIDLMGVFAVFSPNGRVILTVSEDLRIHLWNVETGDELRQFTGHSDAVKFAVFSPDSRMILTVSKDGRARVWDTTSGQQLHLFTGPNTPWVHYAVFASDGRTILTAGDLTARLWDVATGQELRRFECAYTYGMTYADFASDGRTILTVEDKTAHLWDVATGQELRLVGHTHKLSSAVFSPDGLSLLTASEDGTARLWDITTGKELRSFTLGLRPQADALASAVFSADGQWVLTAMHGVAFLWDTATTQVINQFQANIESLSSAVISPNGRQVLTASHRTVDLWEIATRRVLRRFEADKEGVSSAMFSPDGRTILIGSEDGTMRLWDVATWQELRRLVGHTDTLSSMVFSPDGLTLLTASKDGTARLWDTITGLELRRIEGYTNEVNSAVFAPNGRAFLTVIGNQTMHLCDVQSGKELARLMRFTDGTWVVTTPDGRFDTNNLEEIKGLHWIMSDDPFRALPLEIFMRDYYEPRLLPNVLAGEKLPTIRSLSELNRAQPTVQIVNIERESRAGVLGNTVAVTVAVAGAIQEFGLEGQKRRMQTGAYDLRLFRDGQLVAQEPSVSGLATTVGVSAEEELKQWRRDRLIVDLNDGTRQIVFKGIRLPRRAGLKEVQFSAYAFNEDRVKSETARTSFAIPADLSPRIPRAYVISVGVNAFEDPRWDLNFAVKDATQLGEVLTSRLKAQRNVQGQAHYEHVVWIGLTAEAHTDKEGKQQMMKTQARKAQIEAVLKTLAGQPINTEALKGISHADQLRRANPEDLVIIAFSTHGEVDERGRFYLLPHDIGSNSTVQQRRTRAISNDDLSAWLQGLDAIDLVMIVDACHSAASVQNADFKPGPMGSRGLGQLAYDKGMRILTATQPDKPAYETQQIGQGVLTYALVREGLEQHKADYKPKDQHIWLSEWLSYAAERVPGLHNEWGREKGKLHVAQKKEAGEPAALQQPALFDFARKRDALIGRALP